MILPVVVYGHSVLRKTAREIDQKNPEFQTLIPDMFETMYDSDGIGLAAPQVGKSLSIFVIDASPLEDDEPEMADFKKAFINPKIIERSGDRSGFNEGCLSIPNIREEVVRESDVRIQYYDEFFNFYDEKYNGTVSRIIQHEYNHLEGILFTDLIAPIRKRLIRNKLMGMSKGKYKAAYKTILPNGKLIPPTL